MNDHPSQQSYFRNAGLRFAGFYTSLAEKNEANDEKLAEELNNLFLALAIYQRENTWSDVAKLVYSLDVFLDGQGYWDELRFWLEGIGKHSNEVNDSKILLANIVSLAHICGFQGERKQSIDAYHKAIKLAEDRSDIANLAQAYYGLGTIYSSTGEFERTREYWQRALEHAKQCSDGVQVAIIQYNLTLLDKKGSDDSQLVDQLHQATEFATGIFSKLGQTGATMKAMLHGSTLLQTGRDQEARDLFLRVLEQFDNENEKQGQALVLYNLGLIAQREGEINSALEYYRQSLAIANALKDRTGLILLNSSIGMAHLQSERYDLARPYLEQCVRLLRDDGDQKRLADNLYWLGYALANTGDLELAEQSFEGSKTIFSVVEFERVADVDEILTKLRELM